MSCILPNTHGIYFSIDAELTLSNSHPSVIENKKESCRTILQATSADKINTKLMSIGI